MTPTIRPRPIALAVSALWASRHPASLLRGALAAGMAVMAGAAHCAAPLPAGTLPVPAGNFVGSGAATQSVSGTNMTINQNSARTVLNWQSFNVGPGASVRFNQPNASAAALNRIHDANPSVIQGRLSANGQVYLYNRNGILFDRGAQVNVNTLVATTLNISDELFNRGLLSRERLDQAVFAWDGSDADFGKSFVRVENGAEIRTETNGRVLLFAPRVENNGSIATPEGQTVLAAGAKVYLAASADTRLRGFLVEVDPAGDGSGGKASNESLGRIVAERGNVTLAGLAVNQSGRVTATTSASLNGSIVLAARDSVALTQTGLSASRGGAAVLGPGSVTEVAPDGTDKRTIQDTQPFTRSRVTVSGETIHMQRDARILAPGGEVTLTAQRSLEFQAPGEAPRDGVRIQLEPGARIDVAGLRDVAVPIERNIVEIDLRGNELKDAPLQRDGPLRNQTVRIDLRTGTPLTDVSGLAQQLARTTEERMTPGGTVSLRSEGDIVLRQGSAIDVSGGGIRYADGYLATSKLYTADNRVVDIGSALPEWRYLGIADEFVVRNDKFGVAERQAVLGRGELVPGYIEGRDAGSITLNAHRVVADAEFKASTVAGPLQRDRQTRPLGGLLIFGDPGEQPSPADYRLASVRFVGRREFLPGDLALTDRIPERWSELLSVPTEIVGSAGFSRLAVYVNGSIELPQGEALLLAPWGSVQFNARSIDIDGTIATPGGTITARTRLTSGRDGGGLQASDYVLRLGSAGVLSTAGQWVNDSPRAQAASALGPVPTRGGSVTLSSLSDLRLEAGSLVDVSGGAYVSSSERIAFGNAGGIALSTGRFGLNDTELQRSVLGLEGELRGLSGAGGGTLTLAASSVRIGGEARPSLPEELHLVPAALNVGGFAKIAIEGRDGLTIEPGTTVRLLAQNWVLDGSFAVNRSGTPMAALARREYIEDPRGTATELVLGTGSRLHGDLVVGEGAQLIVDTRGRIGLTSARQLTIDGTLNAPAGEIALSVLQPSTNDGFLAGQSIWLGSASRLLARGVFVPEFRADGSLRGEMLSGGTVSVNAASGYVVMVAGSLIDVSGSAALIDLPAASGGSIALRRSVVGADAGVINLAAREGMLLQGTLSGHAGAAGVAGGHLAVALVRPTVPLAYPVQGDLSLVLSQFGDTLPSGLAAGADIPFDRSGRVRIDAAAIERGGFHRFSAEAEHRIEFEGAVSLRVPRSIELNVPLLAGLAGADFALTTGYLGLSNRVPSRPAPLATARGDARLGVEAEHIELRGNLGMTGFDETLLHSRGDIQLRGVLATPGAARPEGLLRVGGDLTLQARQIYPATRTSFILDVQGADATLSVRGGAPDTPVYSADGRLVLRGHDIVIEGAVKAPFGEIAVEAANRLVLLDRALVSVSGESLVVPYGATELSGRRFVYPLATDNRVILGRPGEKRVTLDGREVLLGQGARIDISGGGELVAAEFLPGTGGSRDVLDPANAVATYAVLPTLAGLYAPGDPHFGVNVQGIEAGDAVALSGVRGLPDGVYALLPARYALLPGAFLVTAEPGTLDMVAGQAYTKPDGSLVVAGHRVAGGIGGSASRAARSTGFNVRPGASARLQSEYLETTATQFFEAAAGVRLPGDAGILAIGAGERLTLEAAVASAAAASARGASVDISAPKIVLAARQDVAVDPGFVVLDVGRLNALEAASLLIGGRRTSDGERVRIDVGTSDLIVANDAGSVLRAPELLLAASDTLLVQAGSALQARGSAALDTRAIVVGRVGGASGDGALVRLSAGAQVDLERANVSRARGVLQVEAGSSVAADGAMRLDATVDTQVDGSLVLGGQTALALGAGRISLGAVGGVQEGLALSEASLAAFGLPARLSLRSYSSVDFFGDVDLGGPQLRSLEISAGGIAGYGSAQPAVRIEAERVVLGGGEGLAYSPAPALTGGEIPASSGGLLDVRAGTVLFSGGRFDVRGFGDVRLAAQGEVRAIGSGEVFVDAPLTVAAARVTTADRVAFDLRSHHAFVMTSMSTQPPLSPAAGVGGILGLTGRSVRLGGNIEAPSGELNVTSTGSGPTDGIHVEAGARLSVAGKRVVFEDTEVATGGGRIELRAARGDVALAAGSSIDVSAPAGGDGGSLVVVATQGTFESAGDLIGGSVGSRQFPDPWQSSIDVDAARIAGFGPLQQALDPRFAGDGTTRSTGFTRERVFRVREQDLVLGADVTLRAANVQLVADTGSVDILGRIDAAGASGGRIEIFAGGEGRIDLRDGAMLDARATTQALSRVGTQGRGGRVVLGVGAQGRMSLSAGARIEVSAADSAEAGEVALRAPRIGGDVAIEALAAAIEGASQVGIEAYRVYTTAGGANIASLGTSAGAGRLSFNQINNDSNAYLSTANINAMRTRLGLNDNAPSPYAFRAGVEVRAAGNLTLLNDWDLRTARPGGQPGVLSLRASGDLLLNSSLSDGFSNATANGVLQQGASWSYRLVGGAHLLGANPLAVNAGSGNVEVAPRRIVRTGTGDISMAAGRDVLLRYTVSDLGDGPVLNLEPGVVYTAGAAGPVVPNFPGITIGNIAASFPSGGGDLRIAAGRDIAARSGSGIDIVSAPITQFFSDWLYRQGSLAADGTIGSFQAPRTAWWPRFSDFRQGFGALGGGNVDVRAQGSIDAVGVSLPTNARLLAPNNSLPDASTLLRQGGGDLTVLARKDIASSSFLVGAGTARIEAGGDIGASRLTAKERRPFHSHIALGEGTVSVTSRGDLGIETIASPTTIEQVPGNFAGSGGANRQSYFFTYGDDSRAVLRSMSGSVTLLNESIGLGEFASRFASVTDGLYVYPSTVLVHAPTGSVRIGGDFQLYPSRRGGLELLARDAIAVEGRIGMIDAPPERLPTVVAPDRTTQRLRLQASGLSSSGIDAHSNPPLHLDNLEPVRIIALLGDISGPVTFDGQGVPSVGTMAILPKPVLVSAGGDLRDVWIFGQNLRADDVSQFFAGGDLRYSTVGGSGSRARLEWGGPGRLEVAVGGSIDLGDSQGIVTRGNLNNPALAEQGASIALLTGGAAADYVGFIERASARAEGAGRLDVLGPLVAYVRTVTGDGALDETAALAAFKTMPAHLQAPIVRQLFFDALKETGRAAPLAFGGIERYALGYNAIADLFPPRPGSSYAGNLDLFFSQVKTEQGGDIEILVPGGVVNAGLASIGGSAKSDAQLGIVTVRGGSIRAMVQDDFLVNQSRVFTLQGGDILIWSSDGNIDAGRGAKSATATPPPQLVTRGDQVFLDISNSIAGSGIGVLIAKEGVIPGDVDLIAPRGEINAGEAPIRAAGNINIAAERVVGADNIQVAGTSTGVSLQAAPTLASSFSTASNPAAEATRSVEQATRAAGATATAQALAEQGAFKPTFLTVEVLGFGEEAEGRARDRPAPR